METKLALGVGRDWLNFLDNTHLSKTILCILKHEDKTGLW